MSERSQQLATTIEAILYLKGQPLNLSEIATSANCTRQEAKKAILELMSIYAQRPSALEVVETPAGYSLQLRSQYQELVHHLIPAELKIGTLRTLAAIALYHPILQTDLIDLRGSSAYQQVQELVELGLIRKKPQQQGRSYWLEVTDKFYQYFEVEQLSQIMQPN